jgi:hypothetical protein
VDTALIKRWQATETLLARARAAFPPPSHELREDFDRAIADYERCVSHNELGLAFEALRDAATLVPSRGGVWKDLIRAAELMDLNDQIPELQHRFEAAASTSTAVKGQGDG